TTECSGRSPYRAGVIDTDAAWELPRLREDPTLVVGSVPRVVAVGRAFRRRYRLPRVWDRPYVAGLTWLRAAGLRGCTHDVQLRRDWHAGQSRRQVLTSSSAHVRGRRSRGDPSRR